MSSATTWSKPVNQGHLPGKDLSQLSKCICQDVQDTGVGNLILTILRTTPKKEQMVNGCRILAYAICNMHAIAGHGTPIGQMTIHRFLGLLPMNGYNSINGPLTNGLCQLLLHNLFLLVSLLCQ